MELDEIGATWLTSRDDYEHGIWILHPELVPVKASLPAAGEAASVTVRVRRGTPLSIRFIPSLDTSDCVFLTVLANDGRVVGHGKIDVPDRDRLAPRQVVEVSAPFALPPGVFEAKVSGSYREGRSIELRVDGTAPVVLDVRS